VDLWDLLNLPILLDLEDLLVLADLKYQVLLLDLEDLLDLLNHQFHLLPFVPYHLEDLWDR
jgi:hypothetical protein